jgi:CheY-like chemotaxis protein
MEKKLFCEHCNEEVLTYSVMKDGREEVCCLYCGLPLQKRERQKEMAETEVKATILHADDSAFMRELVKDIAEKNRLCSQFLPFDNGEKLITHYLKSLLNEERTSLIILDIRMPFLSGLSTAIAIRAMENALEKPKVPILFFSVKQADEDLQKFIAHTAPSFYLNKGATENIEDLEKRLVYALKTIASRA